MLFRLIRGGLVAVGLVYVLFILDCGGMTGFQRIMAVARTQEAQDMGREVRTTTRELSDQVREELLGEHNNYNTQTHRETDGHTKPNKAHSAGYPDAAAP